MNRIFMPKRKCRPLPAGADLLPANRAKDRPEPPHPRETPAQRPSKKRGAIKRRVILSVSDDLEFDRRLRTAALERGQVVIRVESVEASVRIIHSECCGVILIDLDFAGTAAWELAGALLEEPACPPVVLMTGQGEQFDLRMAVMAGSIFDKSGNPDLVLNVVNDLFDVPSVEQARRSVAQRGIIRRLTPSGEPAPLIAAQRFWGINE